MRRSHDRYAEFRIVDEMLDAVDVLRRFDPAVGERLAEGLAGRRGLLCTGEGSSRILPGKHARYRNLLGQRPMALFVEGAAQAMEYRLDGLAVLGASNSGRTRELVRLFTALGAGGHTARFAVTAAAGSPLEALAEDTHVLTCGGEEAVAATKSVVEQTLVCHALVAATQDRRLDRLDRAAASMASVLAAELPADVVTAVAGAETVYVAGRDDGVGEELVLKANEIVRKRSAFLEGTYLLHGVEEVMTERDVVVLVEPFAEEEDRIEEVIVGGAGVPVVAIASRPTRFATIVVPDDAEYRCYLELAAGWSLLVEAGLELGVDIDRPSRARKVGNQAGEA